MMHRWGGTALAGKMPSCEFRRVRCFPAFLLSLAACTAAPPPAPENAADPAIAEALAEPLMTDPQMTAAAAPDAIGPGDLPPGSPVPLEGRVDADGTRPVGEVAAQRVREAAFAGCDAAIGYSAMWSVRLPALLALPAGARLGEAAGSDRPGCALRIVRFGIVMSPQAITDRYAMIARRGGFTVTRNAKGLTAARADIAFAIDLTPSRDGTRVDLISRAR